MHSILRKSLAILVLVLAISLATTTTLADGGGHLWFYSFDPPDTLPNPQDPGVDPYYHGPDPDPWVTESIVIPPDDWDYFEIWLACAQFESFETMLVVSINDAAALAIDDITITTYQDGSVIGDITVTPTDFDTSGVPPGCLAPHGVFNSAEFYGYVEVDAGDLYSPTGTPYKTKIVVEITLLSGADTSGMKIHFDAYGHTEDDDCMFSPYSHDLTIVPELGTILLAAASFSALALYALKRRKLPLS